MARKFLVPIDLTKLELLNARIQNLSSAPASPVTGQVYYNTTTNALYFYNGTSWTQAGGVSYGTLAARPAATSVSAGTLYYATDNYLLYFSDGATWQQTNAFGSVTAQTTYGASSADGTSTNYARTDHTHGTPSLSTNAPTSITATSSSAGSGTTPSKDDHVHGFTPANFALSSFAVPTANISLNSYKITSLADPTADQDAATKLYVDTVVQGLNIHDSVVAATPNTLASITGGTVTYSNGASGVGATLTLSVALPTLDGVTLTNGARILVKNEVTDANNGVYTWATGGTVLTRSTDFDSTAEMGGGDFFFVTGGSTYDNTGWVCIDKITVVGTTPVVFSQFSGAGTYTAGYGLSLTGTTFAVNTTVIPSKYSTAIGDGSNTSYTVTHNLATRDVTVTVYDASNYSEVFADVVHTTTNTVTVSFSTAPSLNAYRVVVIG
jgi:hypothetical protein